MPAEEYLLRTRRRESLALSDGSSGFSGHTDRIIMWREQMDVAVHLQNFRDSK